MILVAFHQILLHGTHDNHHPQVTQATVIAATPAVVLVGPQHPVN
jgi:hypothetical protein